uniref:Uncharacterized protein n=1 Tax=Ananas comosus var. bracteatus TaxID=296719 RepID=A0A6V7QCU7_ANACO|nr:unnamed protein product [Ananas comosus var. bracteatus]
MASADQTTAECRELAAMMKASNEKVRAEAQLGKPLIQKSMEVVKKAAAHDFCNSTRHSVEDFYRKVPRHSVEDFYRKVRAVAGEARSGYADLFEYMSEKEFADIVFFDGCYLLEFVALMTGNCMPSSSIFMSFSTFRGTQIGKDILLLENQIPWVVLEALMSLRRVRIHWFARAIVSSLEMESPPQFDEGAVSGYKPCHLLDLVRESYLAPALSQNPVG